MDKPTLLQQARHMLDAACYNGPGPAHLAAARFSLLVDAFDRILQHLEQQQAATRGPAQVPSEQQINELIRKE